MFDQMLRDHEKFQPTMWTAVLVSGISQSAHTHQMLNAAHTLAIFVALEPNVGSVRICAILQIM